MLRWTIAACAASLTIASSAFADPSAPAEHDPGPGHVIELPVHPVSAASAPAPAPAPAPSDADAGPATGFMIEGRIAQTLAPIDLDASTPYHVRATPPVIALGYRSDGYALGFGPVVDHYEWGNQTVNVVGLSAHVEADVVQSADRKNEGYFLGGGSVAMASLEIDPGHVAGHPAIGLFGGFGARH